MFKALLRKEMYEVLKPIFWNNKTGKKRPVPQIVFLSILFIFIFLVLSAYFYLQSIAFSPLLDAGKDALYFSSFFFISTILVVILSNLMLYNMLYVSKDNELLLSLPIKPVYILGSRLVPQLIVNFIIILFELTPVYVMYLTYVPFSFMTVLGMVLSLILLPIFTFSISSLIVFIIGLVLARVRSKNTIQIILTLIMSITYSVFFNIAVRNTGLIFNIFVKLEGLFNSYLFYFGIFGRALSSVSRTSVQATSTLLTLLITFGFFALMLFILHRTFFTLVNSKAKQKTVKFTYDLVRVRKKELALIKLQNDRLIKNAVYFLNCGLGSVLMLIAAVAIFFLRNVINSFPYTNIVTYMGFVMFVLTTDNVSSASVSMEGQTIYISKSLPVSIPQILKSKIIVHLLYSSIPLFFLLLSMILFLNISLTGFILILLSSVLYSFYVATLGLINDLRHGYTNWVSETVAVKENYGMVRTIFETLFPSMLITIFSFFISNIHLTPTIVAIIILAILLILNVITCSDLKKNGTRLFMEM